MKSESDGHSVHFAHYAAKLERHLRNHGITCRDADMVIEESSILYFEKLRGRESSLFRLIRRQDPADLFIEAACKAIKKLMPGAQDTFGSTVEVNRCIR